MMEGGDCALQRIMLGGSWKQIISCFLVSVFVFCVRMCVFVRFECFEWCVCVSVVYERIIAHVCIVVARPIILKMG